MDNRANTLVIFGLIALVIVIAIVAAAVIWNAMKSTAADVTTFGPSFGTILLVAFVAGAIIAVVVLLLARSANN